MGKLINEINGPFTGKVGTVSGSSRHGVHYIKAATKKRTKKVSKKEKENRTKFAIAQFWLQPITDFIRQGFNGFTYKPSSQGFVAAKSYLLNNAFEGIKPDLTINPALMKVSYGNLPLPVNIRIEQIAEKQLKFSWENNWGIPGIKSKDQVMMLAYDIENEDACFQILGQFRDTGQDILRFSGRKPAGNTYHVYIAFVADDRSRQSDSLYLGAVTMT